MPERIEVARRADVQAPLNNSRSGKNRLREIVVHNDLELVSGMNDGHNAFPGGEVNVITGGDRR